MFSKASRAAALTLAALAAAAPLAAQVALTGAGATFPNPIYSKWFDAYNKKTGVQINYQSIGSGAGIQQVKAGTVDFGASDAALSNDRLKEMPRKVLHFPMVGGAVALAYNLPGLATPLRLTAENVTGIYMGKITMWNDKAVAAANPGVVIPAVPILAVHRSDGSGTTNIFTTYLSAVSGEWKELVGANTSVSWPSGIGGKGNEGVSGLVRQTPGAIGYVELAYANQNKLPTAELKNHDGQWVKATLAATSAAAAKVEMPDDYRVSITNAEGKDAWPIASFTYLLIYKDQQNAAKGDALLKFSWWAVHDGQKSASALDYAPLPQSVVHKVEKTLKSMTVNGKSALASAEQ